MELNIVKKAKIYLSPIYDTTTHQEQEEEKHKEFLEIFEEIEDHLRKIYTIMQSHFTEHNIEEWPAPEQVKKAKKIMDGLYNKPKNTKEKEGTEWWTGKKRI